MRKVLDTAYDVFLFVTQPAKFSGVRYYLIDGESDKHDFALGWTAKKKLSRALSANGFEAA
jgi:hypothetical protein